MFCQQAVLFRLLTYTMQPISGFVVGIILILCCVPTPICPSPNGISLVESEGSRGNNKYQKKSQHRKPIRML